MVRALDKADAILTLSSAL